MYKIILPVTGDEKTAAAKRIAFNETRMGIQFSRGEALVENLTHAQLFHLKRWDFEVYEQKGKEWKRVDMKRAIAAAKKGDSETQTVDAE